MHDCSVLYSGLSQCLNNKLKSTQNKMIRFVLNLDCRASIIAEHFKTLKELPFLRFEKAGRAFTRRQLCVS